MDKNSRGPRATEKAAKIISKRIEKLTVFKRNSLKVQTKTLSHSVRSFLAVKEQTYNLEEDSQALISEDLFKIIDINTETKSENNSSTAVSCQSKSIFREIDTKFEELSRNSTPKTFTTNNYLISDKDLQNLVAKKYLENKNLILNCWEKNLQNFLTIVRAGNFSNILFKRLVDNQSKINANSVVYELDFKFRETKLAESFVKRKFVRRYNELAKLQDLNANLITSFEATDLIREVRLGELPKMPVDVSAKPLNVTENTLDVAKFSHESFRTPEKQKYKISDFSVQTQSLTPVIKTKINLNYLENIKDNSNNNRYIFEIKQSKKQNIFTDNNSVTTQYDSLNLNTIFDRPKKAETLRKDRKRFNFEYTSPKSTKPADCVACLTPNRKLNFNETNRQKIKPCFDFAPLETAPKRVVTCLTQNVPIFGGGMSLKRPLESIQTPEEMKLRRMENIVHISENEELGQMPRPRNTPEFRYGPSFFH